VQQLAFNSADAGARNLFATVGKDQVRAKAGWPQQHSSSAHSC
jgi:hypothetical protein